MRLRSYLKHVLYAMLISCALLQITGCMDVQPVAEETISPNIRDVDPIESPDSSESEKLDMTPSVSPDGSDVHELQSESPWCAKTASIANFTDLIPGCDNTFGITESGELYAWGYNDEGCLGLHVETDVPRPTQVQIPEKVIDVVPGSIAIALTDSGNIYTWGIKQFGYEGGPDTREYDAFPEKMEMPETITKIYNGHGAVGLAQGSSGSLYIWGYNAQGNLGNGTTVHSMVPEKLELPSRVMDISCYSTHVIALCEDGKVYTWGSNYYGELGDGTEITISYELLENNKLYPEEISIDGKVIDVAAGSLSSYALTDDGKVYAWGAVDLGQPGVGEDNVKFFAAPQRVPIPGSVKEIAVGDSQAYALLDNGDVYVWGKDSGEDQGLSTLGIETEDHVISTPARIPNIEKIRAIRAGSWHFFAWTEDGDLYAWGYNFSNCISSNLPPSLNVPTLIIDADER